MLPELARGFVVVVLLAQVAGCDRGAEPDHIIQRDSAGVRIVESPGPVWGEGLPWTLGVTPLLDLAETGSGPDHEFFRVVDATRLSDGSVLVANQGSRELRVYSATGQFERSVGAAGEGPGEFSRMASVHELSDGTLAVFDSWLGRITMFSRDLELVGTRSLSHQSTRILRLEWDEEDSPIGVTESGAALGQGAGLYRTTRVVQNFGERGDTSTTLATLQGSEGFLFEYGDIQPLFARSGHMAVSGTEVYLGDADLLEVRVYSTKGEKRRVMRAPDFDLSLGATEIETERGRLLSADMPAPFREVIQSLPAPMSRPAYSDLLVDEEGHVWAPEVRTPGAAGAALAQVFDPDGRWLGPVKVPQGFRLMEVGSDHVLGVHRDELGVERVQIRSLTRGGP